MSNGKPKGLMRDAVAALLPAEILTRRKSGFQVDAPQFFHQQLQGLADHYLNDAAIRRHQLFNPAFVKEVRTYGTNTRFRWHFFMLYLMICTHMWIELFEQGITGFDHQ